ncbi:uncharacterized protein LOC130973041 [Arachis stenosperma]|uniref:uncharacterized protein LOC130973041 n=1 Tax=Arachis stenosperma TaxID=217475 RepID=UPI0025AB9E55|nr:uncharacterized protein LOC130973041 [Arachis stenosperma]
MLLHRQRQHQQHLFSLTIQLHRLNSKLSLLESSIEKINHELQSKEDDVAQMENVILEQENIAPIKNTMDSIQPKGSEEGETRGLDSPDIEPEKQDFQGWLPEYQDVNLSHFQSFILAEWNNYWRPNLDKCFQMIFLKMSQVLRDAGLCIEMVKTEWMPFLKNQVCTFKSNLKSHYDILSAETVEAYKASKNILLSNFVKLQRAATPFMQELIPVLKHHVLNFMYNLKSYFDFISSQAVEAYYASKKFFPTDINKLERSATSFMQEMYNYAKPYMNQIATMAKIYFDTTLVILGIIIKKIIILFHDLRNG